MDLNPIMKNSNKLYLTKSLVILFACLLTSCANSPLSKVETKIVGNSVTFLLSDISMQSYDSLKIFNNGILFYNDILKEQVTINNILTHGVNEITLISKDTIYSTKFKHNLFYTFDILYTLNHDNLHFTQGLVIEDNYLYESTGLLKKSAIYKYKLENSTKKLELIDSVANPSNEFGEGITIVGKYIYQLTWQNRLINILAKDKLKFLKKLYLEGEGWGVTKDRELLVVSDGTNNIKIIDAKSFSIIDNIYVVDDNISILGLNELELVDDYLLANIWQTNKIVVIDYLKKCVIGYIDLTPIVNREVEINKNIDVLNGIAYDKANKQFYITGKNWSNIYVLDIHFKL